MRRLVCRREQGGHFHAGRGGAGGAHAMLTAEEREKRAQEGVVRLNACIHLNLSFLWHCSCPWRRSFGCAACRVVPCAGIMMASVRLPGSAVRSCGLS